jgi:O-antigen ligase
MKQLHFTKPEIISWCDLGIRYLIYAIVFLTPITFAFLQGNFNVFELNKLVIFRAAVSLIFVLYLIKISTVGKIEYSGRKKILLFWLLILLAYVFGVIFSIHPSLSLFGNYARQQGFLSYFFYLLFGLMLILNLKDLKQTSRIILTAILSSVAVCFYGLMQALNLDPLLWNSFGHRIFSSLGQPNFLGYYLVMVMPLTVYYLIFVSKAWWYRLLIGLALLLQFVALALTYSRGAVLGLLAGIVVFVALWLLVKGYKKTLWSLLAIFVISVILIAGNLSTVAHFKTHINYIDRVLSSLDFETAPNSSSAIRFKYWGAAWSEFKDNSLFRKAVGCGIDCQESVYVRRYDKSWGLYESLNAFPDRAHNLFFDTLLQFGLIGLLLIAAFSLYIIAISLKYLKHDVKHQDQHYWLVITLLTSISIYFVSNLFGFPLTTHYIYLYLCLALLWYLIVRGRDKALDINGLSVHFRYLVCFLLFVFLAFIYWSFSVNNLVADRYYLQAKKAENKHDCRGMILDTQEMMYAFPFSNFYKSQFIHFNVNCFDSIMSKDDKMILIENVVNAIDLLQPDEYEYYSLLNTAHAYSVFGGISGRIAYNKAEEAYKKLITLSPYISVDYQDYGRMKMWANDYDEAIAIFKQGITTVPDLNTPGFAGEHYDSVVNQLAYLNELIGSCYTNKEDYQTAIDYYQQSLNILPKQIRVYKSIAGAYYLLNQIDQTIKYNLLAYQADPTNPEWSNALALLYKEKGDSVLAQKYARQAEKLVSGSKQIQD